MSRNILHIFISSTLSLRNRFRAVQQSELLNSFQKTKHIEFGKLSSSKYQNTAAVSTDFPFLHPVINEVKALLEAFPKLFSKRPLS